jgi:hypothetical protein
MNLFRMLQQRAADCKPLKVGLIGAGKFGAMYLAQARHTPGIHIVGIADLAPARAAAALARTGWDAARYGASSFADAAARGATYLTDDALMMIAAPEIEIVIDATGSPAAGIRHVLACCEQGKHVVMVNVEADALAGPLLAQKAAEAGIVYSLAYGDQPALICEMVDWCRAAGFEVVAAGKGTKYLPIYHGSTPDTVWPHYGFSDEMVQGVRLFDRPVGAILGDVQAVSRDRPGTRHLGRVSRIAPRTDGRASRLAGRRGGDRQTRPQGRRKPGWRGWTYGLRTPAAGARFAGPGGLAAGPRTPDQAQAPGCRPPAGHVGRRGAAGS